MVASSDNELSVGTRSVRALLAAVGLGLAGCGLLPPDYTIHVSNATDRPITIDVNGATVGHLDPNSMADFPPDKLPPRPWTVEAALDGGRELVSMVVKDGAIQDQRALDGTGSYSSVGSRVTLSCGQIWLWVGEPGTGGGVSEGQPGDCDP